MWRCTDRPNQSGFGGGPTAEKFGKLTQAERIAKALKDGNALHPGFPDKVYADKGVTIAWHNMPFQVGGWAGLTAVTQPDVYKTIIKPQGRLYAAGDAYSYLPGWLEGAVTSVDKAIAALPIGFGPRGNVDAEAWVDCSNRIEFQRKGADLAARPLVSCSRTERT